VHSDVGVTPQQRLLDLPHEQPFAADGSQPRFGATVALGADREDFHPGTSRGERIGHGAGLG
jgi:hypothetical protein